MFQRDAVTDRAQRMLLDFEAAVKRIVTNNGLHGLNEWSVNQGIRTRLGMPL